MSDNDSQEENAPDSSIQSVTLTEMRGPEADAAVISHHCVGGCDLIVEQRSGLGIGWMLWDASQFLVDYLTENPSVVENRTVIELGAGCGLCGLATAALGAAKVTLTDTAAVVGGLQAAVNRNRKFLGRCDVSCEVLDWTEAPLYQAINPDIILVSDCTYWKHLFRPLYRTLLLTAGYKTTILLAHKFRRETVEAEAFRILEESFSSKLLRTVEAQDGAAVQICELTFRPDLDLEDCQRSVVQCMKEEVENLLALLARLDAIEEDMNSICMA